VVFVDEAAEDVDAFDVGEACGGRQRRYRRRGGGYRDIKVDAAMRPGGVVVPQILCEHSAEMSGVPDQGPVEAFGSDGADPPFGVRVGPTRRLPPIGLMGSDLFG